MSWQDEILSGWRIGERVVNVRFGKRPSIEGTVTAVDPARGKPQSVMVRVLWDTGANSSHLDGARLVRKAAS